MSTDAAELQEMLKVVGGFGGEWGVKFSTVRESVKL
jgi:hypothetical protein